MVAGNFVLASRPPVSTALKNVVLQALERLSKESKTLKELAQAVQNELDSTQGLGWHVLIGKDFAVDIRYRKGCCALLHNKSANVKALIYRTTTATTTPPSVKIPQTNEELIKPTIMESTMSQELQDQVVVACQRLVATNAESDALCSQLKAWLTQMYGNTWHVAVATSRDLVGSIHANSGTYLDVIFTKSQSKHTRFLLYQHAGFESSLDLLTLLHRVFLVLAAMAGAMFLFYRVSYRSECVAGITDDCTNTDHTKAIAGEHWQFVSTLAVVVFIGAASLLRLSRNSIRQKIKHV